MNLAQIVDAFLLASVNGWTDKAKQWLADEPELANADINAAAMLGEYDAVLEMLGRHPSLVSRRDARRNWDPLLYLCFSRFHRVDPERASGIVRIARTLLERGADPNTCYLPDKKEPHVKHTALYGACGPSNNPALAEVLLEAGANPDDNESLYHSVEHPDHECLELLLSHGADTRQTNALVHMLDTEDPDGVRLLLEHGSDPNKGIGDKETTLHWAIRRGRSLEVIKLLVAHGAKVDTRRETGLTPYAMAFRRGQMAIAEFLLEHGAKKNLGPNDEFLNACFRADEARVRELHAQSPDLARSLPPDDMRLLADAAEANQLHTVLLMLDAGFDITARGDYTGTPLHQAALRGNVDVVKLLLDRGAPVNLRCDTYESTP
ncbi:MAG: ankyrin repeat domain-containing protein, partial [Planctomycetota bacterium]